MSALGLEKNKLKPHFDAVAVYDFLKYVLRPDLADFRSVLSAMQGGGNGLFLLRDIRNQLVPETWPEDAPKVLSMLDGTHPSGIKLSIVKAMGDGRQEIAMPVIDDPYTQRTLAIGPVALPEKLLLGLEKSGITYIAGNDEMARAAITGFLVSGVQERIELQKKGKAPPYFRDAETTRQFVEDFMMAAVSAADYPDPDVLESPSVNIADLLLPISQGKAEVSIYTAAAKKPPILPKR